MKILKIGENIARVVTQLGPDCFSDLKPFAPVIATPKRLKQDGAGRRVINIELVFDPRPVFTVFDCQCALTHA
jgi:hypothetical protein